MESKRVEEEYQTFLEGNQWSQIYQRIGLLCQAYTYTCVEAKKTTNKPLNRYRDVNPYDHSRIILRKEGFVTDYINANLVKMERANREYILTQGPLVYTSGHFWLMVWEQNSPAIIMLNKIVEKCEIKCHSYWPREDINKVVYPDVNMTISLLEEYDYNYYSIRRLKMHYQDTNEFRELWHFHYSTWPDFEVPQSPHAFLDFLKHVREYGALDRVGGNGPAVVHCSAGIGRSGTFCLVDSVLVLIENEGQENVDIQEILLDLRRYRMGLIQTSEQLRFSYKAIVEGIKRLDPDYVPTEEPINESIYTSVADEEEAPPPPPPRGTSLGRPPVRPLPAIPASASMDSMSLFERRRARARFIIQSRDGGVPTLVSLAAATAGLQPLMIPAQRHAAVPPSLARLATMDILQLPVEPYINSMSLFERRRAHARFFFQSRNGGVQTLARLAAATADRRYADASVSSLARLATMAILKLPAERYLGNFDVSASVESAEESDSPPQTPPPREDALCHTPSTASSSYADDDDEDDDGDDDDDDDEEDTTLTPDTVESMEGALRRRRVVELAERVELMKKRSKDADRWHEFKRSLLKPIALTVGVGLVAVVGLFIYTHTKH